MSSRLRSSSGEGSAGGRLRSLTQAAAPAAATSKPAATATTAIRGGPSGPGLGLLPGWLKKAAVFGAFGIPRRCLEGEERELYQAHFCGLCHALAEFGGKTSSLLTNYDLTFWLIVLGALEPPAAVE